eukprot:6324086-Amphidinium_carterae.1
MQCFERSVGCSNASVSAEDDDKTKSLSEASKARFAFVKIVLETSLGQISNFWAGEKPCFVEEAEDVQMVSR